MRQRNLPLLIFACLFGLSWLIADISFASQSAELQSFYVVTQFFSDYGPASFQEILDVQPEGKDVCVRAMRLASATEYCGGNLVLAAERVLPHTTLKKVTGLDLCSYTNESVAAALEAAAPKGMEALWDSATLRIVARCAADEKIFDFPYPEQIDLKALHRNSPRVEALWNLMYKVREQAFGKHFSFYKLSPLQEEQSEDLGVKLLPELISGKFNSGFDAPPSGQKAQANYLAERLKGYRRPPPKRDPSTVTLVNASSLHLVKYGLPRFPAVAKTAHVFGDVRLALVADPQTGFVTDVRLLSGSPVLSKGAIDAAKHWRLSPAASAKGPVTAVLRFQLCPDE